MADEQRSFAREDINKLCWRPAPAPCKLTFNFLTFKVVFQSCVTWATSVPILVFLGLYVFDLGPMYATDRQTDVRRASSLNAPYSRGGGIIIAAETWHEPQYSSFTIYLCGSPLYQLLLLLLLLLSDNDDDAVSIFYVNPRHTARQQSRCTPRAHPGHYWTLALALSAENSD